MRTIVLCTLCTCVATYYLDQVLVDLVDQATVNLRVAKVLVIPEIDDPDH